MTRHVLSADGGMENSTFGSTPTRDFFESVGLTSLQSKNVDNKLRVSTSTVSMPKELSDLWCTGAGQIGRTPTKNQRSHELQRLRNV